jgi:NAD+ synthase
MIPKEITPKQRIKHIVRWIKNYASKNKIDTLVVGVSGGIDSAVVSALCAHTGLYTIAVSMPIYQSEHTHDLSVRHGQWLKENFELVDHYVIDLTPTFEEFRTATRVFGDELAWANSRARLRMTTLYQLAQANSGIVVGTGNKVEDFGVGFFTKYGDGGVDISPIGDCLKTQVWEMGRELGVLQEIIDAAPTDGLWDDGRTDEDQIGMTYPDLELMMTLDFLKSAKAVDSDMPGSAKLSTEQRRKLRRYQELRARNMHKMQPIPVCKMPRES